MNQMKLFEGLDPAEKVQREQQSITKAPPPSPDEEEPTANTQTKPKPPIKICLTNSIQ
jgi:hypothetical protein